MSDKDVRMVTVGRATVGMRGLGRLFERLAAEGRRPDPGIGEELVELAERENYIAPRARADCAKALVREYRRHLGEDVPEEAAALSIRILGLGCPGCEKLAANVFAALEHLGIAAEVEHVRDAGRIGEFGVLGTPALVVDGKVVSAGRALSRSEIEGLISAAGRG